MNELLQIRTAIGISQAEMASRIGMDRTRLCKLENGKAKLRRYYVLAAERIRDMETANETRQG